MKQFFTLYLKCQGSISIDDGNTLLHIRNGEVQSCFEIGFYKAGNRCCIYIVYKGDLQ